ncbi:MAG TPA: pentapeptide repeat-containing protein, partial [Gemmatimonadaceae bacterium]|nr:pentapeptide repeat-containing protein [Gemmatimonadaceae bacterium]
ATFVRARLDDARIQATNKPYTGVVGIDFRGADLTRVTLKNSDLNGTTFANAILRRADLTRCNLSHADLTGAELNDACFMSANLAGARLAHASLVGASLTGVNLEGASLEGADLSLASLNGARLAGADFSGSLWSKTSLARCAGLDQARGFDCLRYGNPSAIDLTSLRSAIAVLPDEFLAHCGIEPKELSVLRRLSNGAGSC